MLSFSTLADKARDEKAWSQARHLYAEQLSFVPERADLWIQYGHALKESGAIRLAECAYRQAIALTPGDSDSYLQLGHLLKIAGASAAAAVAYSTSTKLDQRSDAARDLAEIIRKDKDVAQARREWLRQANGASVWKDEVALCVDVSDLYSHMGQRPTGIQRVQIGVVNALAERVMAEIPLTLIRYEPERKCWIQVPTLEFSELSRALMDGSITRHAALSALLTKDAPDFIFPHRACYLLLGTAWDNAEFLSELEKLKGELGVTVVCMIHDVIPVTVPHFCAEGVGETFEKWLRGALLVSDGLVASSSSTRFEVEQYCAKHNLRCPPISMVRLEVGLSGDHAENDVQAVAALRDRLGFDPSAEEFVLCVGTIEPRKNHTTLFSSWLSLERSGQNKNIPRLLCVGSRGWGPSKAVLQLEAKVKSSNLISVISGLSDADLAYLYRSCLFTVYPSLHEGWGLPISEAFSYGKLVVTGAHTSLVEAGRDLAVYVDVSNASLLAGRIRELLDDRELLRHTEQKIKSSFVPKTWAEVAKEMLAASRSVMGRS